jgi:solute carrier family 35 protein F5
VDGLKFPRECEWFSHASKIRPTNFLQYIFADNTYSKPYFVTYFNTAFFAISLIPILSRVAHQQGFREIKTSSLSFFRHFRRGQYRNEHIDDGGGHLDLDGHSAAPLLQGDALGTSSTGGSVLDPGETHNAVLTLSETAVLSLEFCFLWFLANYFVAACLEYTSVASSTILTSTSSIWTLIFGALLKVEKFTIKKLVGVLACLTGIIMISMVDLSGSNDGNRGKFPHKSQREIAIGKNISICPSLTGAGV